MRATVSWSEEVSGWLVGNGEVLHSRLPAPVPVEPEPSPDSPTLPESEPWGDQLPAIDPPEPWPDPPPPTPKPRR